jgi:nucleoside-diphosphate-sugar epimerase
MTRKKLFCFGYGYTAAALAAHLRLQGWDIAGTTTDPDKRAVMHDSGIDAYLFDHSHPICHPARAFDGVTHVLFSIPPEEGCDPAFEQHAGDLLQLRGLEWAGYLSTTGVYGNRDGAWVDEMSSCQPTSKRGEMRLRAEQQWRSLRETYDFPLHVFRLSGIYGPGRSAIESVRAGTAQRIEKPGHEFNRIHLDDIVQTLAASIAQPHPGAIYNLADDQPAPSSDVIDFACALTGCEPPQSRPYQESEMAPIVRSFYADNKRVKNVRIKEELGVTLLHPDYKSGLSACLKKEIAPTMPAAKSAAA